MKQGDIITIKDDKELIAVPCINNTLCTGCFFFDGKTCSKKEKILGEVVPCWDNSGKHFIFEDKQLMKTINDLIAEIGNTKVLKGVYDDLIKQLRRWIAGGS